MSARAQPTDDDVVVYSGRLFAGAIRRRSQGFIALDPNGRKIGCYRTSREASAALIDAASKAKAVAQ
jgi:hypothetical protein